MQDVLYIDDVERAAALLKPLRIELLKLLAEPRSLAELAESIGESPQKLHYHVKVLERAGLVARVDERRAGAMIEGLYQAAAGSYWLSPALVGQIGGRRRSRDQASLGYLLGLAEEMQDELGRLSQAAMLADVPSFGLDLHVLLPVEQRAAFLEEARSMVQSLAETYGIRDGGPRAAGETFRLVLACYPHERNDDR
jgi:DNA-binding transcriptional ArsR family regulator